MSFQTNSRCTETQGLKVAVALIELRNQIRHLWVDFANSREDIETFNNWFIWLENEFSIVMPWYFKGSKQGSCAGVLKKISEELRFELYVDY